MGHHPCEMLSALAQFLCMTAADPKRKATKMEELDKLILLDSLQKRESSQKDIKYSMSGLRNSEMLGSCKSVLS